MDVDYLYLLKNSKYMDALRHPSFHEYKNGC